jgi:PAS domain S-box-containing protein
LEWKAPESSSLAGMDPGNFLNRHFYKNSIMDEFIWIQGKQQLYHAFMPPIKVLFVDDEPAILDITRIYLERGGQFSVTTAVSAMDAIRLLHSENFDAIVSDYEMPTMNGIEFLAYIKSNKVQCPFILFTGRGREHVVIEALNLGADFYLQKGGDPKSQFAELKNMILQSVSHQQTERELVESEERYKRLLERSFDAIMVHREGTILFVNTAAANLLGADEPENLTGKSLFEIIHPDYLEVVRSRTEAVTRELVTIPPIEEKFLRLDGTSIDVEVLATRLLYQGRPAIQTVFRDISGRKMREKELSAQHELSLKLAAASSIPEIVPHALHTAISFSGMDSGGIYLVNPDTYALELVYSTGLSPGFIQEVSQVPVGSMSGGLVGTGNTIYSDYSDILIEKTSARIKEGLKAIAIIPIRHKDEIIGSYNIASHTLEHISSTNRNILETIASQLGNAISRIRSEDALRRSEEQYREIFENTGTASVIIEPDTTISLVNSQFEQLSGYSRTETEGKMSWTRFVMPNDLDLMKKYHQERRAMQGSAPRTYIFRFIDRKGRIRIIYLVVGMLSGSGKSVASLLDITERTKTENALLENEKFLEDIFNSIQDGISILDNAMNIVRVNRTIEEWYAHALPLVGKKCYQAYHGRDEPCEICPTNRTFRTSSSAIEIVPKIGLDKLQSGWLDLYSFPMFDENTGALKGVIEYARDATDRVNAEKSLRESEEKYRAVVETQEEFICRFRPDGTHIFVNPAYCNYFGMTCEQIQESRFHPNIPKEDQERVEQHFRLLKPDHPVASIQHRIIMPNGDVRWQNWSDKAIFDENGHIIEYQSVGRDITQTVIAEHALLDANRKLNLLNNITRHDILNRITILTGTLDLAKERFLNPEIQEFIGKLSNTATDIEHQIRFTREYQDIGIKAPQWQNLEETFFSSLAHFDLSNIRTTVHADGIKVYTDPLLGKVFSNLVDNSLKYGQKVTEIRVHTEERNNHLAIFFEDNGVGIPVEEKELIFKAGFGKSTGYGLFLVREILDITGISISEMGEPGQGARFRLHVPKGKYRYGDVSPDNGS